MIHGINPGVVKTVVFDLGGVFLEGTVESVSSFGLRVGIDETVWREVAREMFLGGDEGPWSRLERNEITIEAFGKLLEAKLAGHGVALDLAAVARVVGSGNFGGRVRPEIVTACQSLKSVMQTALLTNNIVAWRETWRSKIDVDALFHDVVDSCEVGMRKPEERIYALVEQRLGRQGEALLFIDDLGMNLKGARARGWQTLKYENTVDVLQVLEAVRISAGG